MTVSTLYCKQVVGVWLFLLRDPGGLATLEVLWPIGPLFDAVQERCQLACGLASEERPILWPPLIEARRLLEGGGGRAVEGSGPMGSSGVGCALWRKSWYLWRKPSTIASSALGSPM